MKIDLFEYRESLSPDVLEIVEEYDYKSLTNGLSYNDCKTFLNKVEKLGYTFDYGLDAEPFGLQYK